MRGQDIFSKNDVIDKERILSKRKKVDIENKLNSPNVLT